jgi:putative phosphoribosyl transferase
LFLDRVDAGRRLARRLEYLDGRDAIVLGLPRGGVPVAFEVATALAAPLDVIVVRKLGAPRNPEYALGAIGESGVRVLDPDAIRATGTSDAELDIIERHARTELARRTALYRGGRGPVSVAGKTAVIVDDGIATGATARAACMITRALGAESVVLAVPVAPPDWVESVGPVADEFVCLETPAHFFAVGQWYSDFTQTTDDEVIRCLRR